MTTETTQHRQRTGEVAWWTLAASLAVIALVVAVIALFTPSTEGEAGASGSPRTVAVQLGDVWVSPATLDVAAGEAVTLEVTNVGAQPHDLKVLGTNGTEMLEPGDSETITVGPFQTSTEAWCTVPGHKEAGMVMTINVASAGGEAHGSTATTVPDAATGGNAATIDAAATPAAGWVPRDPVLAPAPSGTVHEITMVASEQVIEVAPGVTQELWVFDGQMPGPTLRGKVGDTFRVTLRNEGRIGHSIDFHASMVAWDDEMRTLQPGEELVYEFTANFAGAYMYHCGTAPALHHIGNGMFGVIIVDPPVLAPVAKEFIMTQSELYLGPQGQPGDLTKMIDEEWDAVVFNGYHNQYRHDPIEVAVGERYRVWVVDEGPSENSAFHVVGTVFDTVFKEGTYLLQPGDGKGGSQVLDLQPAQGGFVEFSFAEDGLYPIVTHKFANVGKGALGFFAAGDADQSVLGGH